MLLLKALVELAVLLVIISASVISNHSYSNIDHSCSTDLTDLGCKCFSESNYDPNRQNTFSCSNRLYKLNCLLSLDQTQVENYYDNVIEDLNKMTGDCWTQFFFENVYRISKTALVHLKLAARNRTNVVFWFKNVLEIDTYAFDTLQLSSGASLVIRIDSNYVSKSATSIYIYLINLV